MGIDRDWFKILCWDKITITIDDWSGNWKNIMRRKDASSIEKLGELDLWKVSWVNYTGEVYYPYGSTATAQTYTTSYTPVEDWCNAQ